MLVTARELTVTLRAFVVRGRRTATRQGVHARLLHKNLSTRHWRFAIDDLGDVFALADARLEGIGVEVLDGLLGELSSAGQRGLRDDRPDGVRGARGHRVRAAS